MMGDTFIRRQIVQKSRVYIEFYEIKCYNGNRIIYEKYAKNLLIIDEKKNFL